MWLLPLLHVRARVRRSFCACSYIHNTRFTSIPNSIAYLPRLDTYFSQTFDALFDVRVAVTRFCTCRSCWLLAACVLLGGIAENAAAGAIESAWLFPAPKSPAPSVTFPVLGLHDGYVCACVYACVCVCFFRIIPSRWMKF